jgi:hypothetical protein
VNSISISKYPLQLIRLPTAIQLKSLRDELQHTIGCPDCHAESPQAIRLTWFKTDQRISSNFKAFHPMLALPLRDSHRFAVIRSDSQ